MPDYNFTITVPANTSKDDPVATEMILCKGVIASGTILFPLGCSGLVHVIIADGKGQLYPANADDTYHGDGVTTPLVGRHVIDIKPYKLFAYAWSPNTDFDHTIQIGLAMLSEEEASPYRVISDFVAVFKRMLGLR